MKILQKIKDLFSLRKKCCEDAHSVESPIKVEEKPAVEQISERLKDVSNHPLSLVEDDKAEPVAKVVKPKAKKKPISEVEGSVYKKPKAAKKSTKTPPAK